MWRKWKCRIPLEKIYSATNTNKIVSNNVESILTKSLRDILKAEEAKEFLPSSRGLTLSIKSNQ